MKFVLALVALGGLSYWAVQLRQDQENPEQQPEQQQPEQQQPGQQQPEQQPEQQQPGQMPEYKPQKEHELLKQFEGEWDATCSMTMKPGEKPMESTGVETNKITHGGFWLMSEFKGEMHGKQVEGMGHMGYDPLKMKYVATWVGSDSPFLMVVEGNADEAGKTIVLSGKCTDPMTQQPVQLKLVYELPAGDAWKATFYKIGADMRELQVGEIQYKRRK